MLKKKLNFNLFFYIEYTLVYFLVAFLLKNLFLHYQQLGFVVQNRFFEIEILRNTGAAFSILKNGNLFLGVFAIIVFVMLSYYVMNNGRELKLIDVHALSFLSAGILSNALERFLDGYVTDYFKLVFINFPVFNLADVFINIGVVFLVISLLFCDKKGKNNE